MAVSAGAPPGGVLRRAPDGEGGGVPPFGESGGGGSGGAAGSDDVGGGVGGAESLALGRVRAGSCLCFLSRMIHGMCLGFSRSSLFVVSGRSLSAITPVLPSFSEGAGLGNGGCEQARALSISLCFPSLPGVCVRVSCGSINPALSGRHLVHLLPQRGRRRRGGGGLSKKNILRSVQSASLDSLRARFVRAVAAPTNFSTAAPACGVFFS